MAGPRVLGSWPGLRLIGDTVSLNSVILKYICTSTYQCASGDLVDIGLPRNDLAFLALEEEISAGGD